MPVFYDCQRCTACCRWPGEVKLLEGELGRMADFLGLSEVEFIQRFTQLRSDRQALVLDDQPGGACVFLEGQNCRVQPVKPQQCRDFPNRWNFPGFQGQCRAIARQVDDAEYARLMGGLPVLVLVGLLAFLMGLGKAEASDVWRIGVADESSAEFRQWIHPATGERQIDYLDPRSDAVFVVGTSRPAEDWPAYQPGSGSGPTGFREHPATILFALEDLPAADFVLRVALLSYSARLPALQVEFNGHLGRFFQEPRLAYSGGDAAVFFQPHYATSLISCELRREWFIAGTNRLVLTAVDDPLEREEVRPLGFPWPGNSGLIYDAVWLETLSSPPFTPVTARLSTTPFFRQEGAALLAEVEVVVRFRHLRPTAELSLEMDGARPQTATAEARSVGQLGDFGEARLRFWVPAWEGMRSALVRIAAKGDPAAAVEIRTNLPAARRWQLWVVPHEHLDVGYTDHDAKVAELQSRVLDEAMTLADRHPGFRYTADGFWVVEEYLAGRSAAAREELVKAMRAGRIFVPAVHGSLFTGSASLEGLIRNLYPSHRFAQEHGTPFDVAILTDVPSFSWSFASVLAAAGVKYFAGASDAYRGPFLLQNRLNERSPHQWEGPDGGRVTTWYSRHYHQMGSLFGMPPRVTLGRESLPRFLQAYDRTDYRSEGVIVYGTQVENVALEPEQAAFAAKWNGIYAYPRIRYGGVAEALAAIAPDPARLPVVRGDGGPYWEDGLAANARVTALARRNSRRILSAEKIATTAHLANPRFLLDPSLMEAAWRHSRLIDEHTWHADCSVRDPGSEQARRQGEAKDAHATDAERALDRVIRRGLSAAAAGLPVGPGSILLFNPLSWPRRDVVEFEIGRGQGLVDSETGAAVAFDLLRVGPVYQRVRVTTPEVPALGYAALRLRPLPVVPASLPTADPEVVENEFYRVEWDRDGGGIRRLIDRRSGRDLVDAHAEYRLGQWLYVTGGDELPNRLVQYSTVSQIPRLTVHGAKGVGVSTSVVSRLGATGWFFSEAPNFPRIETQIFLPADRREVRLTVRVQKSATFAKEAGYVAFPLAISQPRFRYATPNGWVDPARDLLPGAGREWFAIQDWLSVESLDPRNPGEVTISPLDAPLVTLGDLVRGTWPTEFGARPARVFSYAMSNYTPEGYAAAQGGEFTFRYVLTSADAFDAVRASRQGAEALNPVEVGEVTRNDQRTVAPSANDGGGIPSLRDVGAWLGVEPAAVHVVAWKAAEDGRGTVVRLLETSGSPTTASVSLRQARIAAAWRASAVEDDLERLTEADGRVRIPMAGFGISTLRLLLDRE